MISIAEKFVKLSRQLFPTGRVFRLFTNGTNERLHKALAVSESRCHIDVKSTFDSLIPDNPRFTEQDAADWARRLGLINNVDVPLSDRKDAILRKMASPGINPARSGALWLEKQLRDAGFDVYVHENIFPAYPTGYYRMAPGEVNPAILNDLEHGEFEHGHVETGSYFNYIIANSILNSEDISLFNSITDFGCSFFICGQTLGTYANVLASREPEFRQLVLGQKQTQAIAFCYLNFV